MFFILIEFLLIVMIKFAVGVIIENFWDNFIGILGIYMIENLLFNWIILVMENNFKVQILGFNWEILLKYSTETSLIWTHFLVSKEQGST